MLEKQASESLESTAWSIEHERAHRPGAHLRLRFTIPFRIVSTNSVCRLCALYRHRCIVAAVLADAAIIPAPISPCTHQNQWEHPSSKAKPFLVSYPISHIGFEPAGGCSAHLVNGRASGTLHHHMENITHCFHDVERPADPLESPITHNPSQDHTLHICLLPTCQVESSQKEDTTKAQEPATRTTSTSSSQDLGSVFISIV